MIALLLVLLVVPVTGMAGEFILNGKSYDVFDGTNNVWVLSAEPNETILECSPDLTTCTGTPALEQFAQCHRLMQEALRDVDEWLKSTGGVLLEDKAGEYRWWMPQGHINQERWDRLQQECVR